MAEIGTPTLRRIEDGSQNTSESRVTGGHTKGFLAMVTGAHFLLNLGLNGQQSILGATHLEMIYQAGGTKFGEVLMLVGGAIGCVGANLFTGWYMDRYTSSHHVFALAAFVSTVNLAIMPHVSGLPAMVLCNALMMTGSGVVDCSFGALAWTARECGVSNDGMYMGIKNFGTCFGMALVFLMTFLLPSFQRESPGGRVDYSTLAYMWSGLCAASGIAIVILPSPARPQEALKAREKPGLPRSIAWRETLVVVAGTMVGAICVGIFCSAMTLAQNWIGVSSSKSLLLFYMAMTALGQLVMSTLMPRLPAAAAHVILLFISTAGCILNMFAFIGTGSGSPRITLLWAGYGVMGVALLSNFSVLFTFLSSLVSMSGSRSSIIGLGAAANPLFTAAAVALGSPVLLWFSCAALLVWMAVVVLVLQCSGPRFLQRVKDS